jgi:hypothetical protein
MQGRINLKANVQLPPEHRPFLERLRLDGDCDISHVAFTNPNTQFNIAKLSTKAEGEPQQQDDPPPVDSKLSGAVHVRDGTATLEGVNFIAPGAQLQMHGTYNLISDDVHGKGRLLMKAEMSEATTGWKSWLMAPFNKLFKTKHHGSAIAVTMAGKYPHAKFKTELKPKKHQG